jgi:4-hydroxybenzoate polyprenyltransferase
MAGLMYTFRILPLKLRRFGRLKPFVIGFVWAGVVTIFPVLFWQIRNPNEVAPGISTKALLWLQNFLFISSLAIVFDIKDFKSDKRLKLQTYPAKYGIKKTIHFAIVPLALLCLMILVIQHIVFPYTVTESLLQSFPYFILILITGKLYAERNLLFYLAGIDGLMLLKAICGIISITLL